jgi:hypothetical protein
MNKDELRKRIAEELNKIYPNHPWSEASAGILNMTDSIDAALTLPAELGGWTLSTVPISHCIGRKQFKAVLSAYNPKSRKVRYADQSGRWTGDSNDSLAEAICRAWLLYREATK